MHPDIAKCPQDSETNISRLFLHGRISKLAGGIVILSYLDYIRTFVSFIFAIVLMYTFLDCRLANRKKLYKAGMIAAVFLFINLFFIYHFGYTRFMALFPFLVQLPVFFVYLFISRFSAIKIFFVNLTFIAITTSITLIALIITSLWGYDRVIMNLICYALYLPAGFLIYRYMRPSFLYMLRKTNKGWIGFCAIPFSYTAITYLVGKYDLDTVISRITIIYAAGVLILAFAAYALILRYFIQAREQLTIQAESDILRMQVASAKVHFEELKESQEKAAIYRHDMRHHLNLINAFLVNDDKHAAQKYIADVEQNIEDSVVENLCSNYAVNLLLNSFLIKAKNEGILVSTQIDLPQRNAISDIDLCVIFSNAIENAMNACRSIPYTNERSIKINCRIQNEKCIIQIVNTCEETISFADGLPIINNEGHGFGTRSIVAVVQKYGGVCSFAAESGFFKVNLII